MGETDIQTMSNVTIGKYDFDDEAFDDISEDARDFISKLLVKDKGYATLFTNHNFTMRTCKKYFCFLCLLVEKEP